MTTGTPVAIVTSAAGLSVGMYASAAKVPNGARIIAISGTAVTLSANATGTVGGAAIRFSPLLDAQTIGAVGGALNSSLVTANLPPYTPASSIANGAITTTTTYQGSAPGATNSAAPQGGPTFLVLSGTIPITSTQAASTFAGAVQGGASRTLPNGPADDRHELHHQTVKAAPGF
jgi:hypothetical protein